MLGMDATILFRIPALLLTITVHEYAHGAMSASLGDPTPEMDGRLTMNPLAHLDLVGSLMLLLVGFGWAKPVRIDPRYYANPRAGQLKLAFAGPGSNLFLCFVAMALQFLMVRFMNPGSGVMLFLNWLMMYNVWFAFFNLIPIPPMDGYQILRNWLPFTTAMRYESLLGPYSTLVLIALCFTGIIGVIVSPLASLYLSLCHSILNLLFFF